VEVLPRRLCLFARALVRRRRVERHLLTLSVGVPVSVQDEMLVESGTASLLDSPTLARVERALMRQESDTASYCPSLISMGTVREMHAIKKGLLWQQREKIFSRWKERYFILTKDYLHCFKRSSGLHNISPMGQFIFKVKLVEVEKIEWINKKSYSAIGITLQGRESRILLRSNEDLEDWFELLEECIVASKERRKALRKLHDPSWDGRETSSLKLSEWLDHRTDRVLGETESMAGDAEKRRSRCGVDVWHRPSNLAENRLSLLTDIDINSCSSPVETPPPSVPSTFRGRPCRLNNDVFFMSNTSGVSEMRMCKDGPASFSGGRSILSPVPSFKAPPPPNAFSPTNSMHVKYRDRAQSEALSKMRSPDIENRRASYVFSASHHI